MKMKRSERSERIEDFLNLLRESQQEYNIAVSDEKEKNDETQDLLHSIELQNHIPYNELLIFQVTKQVRQKRRRAKDTIQQLQPIVEWFKENQKVVKDLERLLGNVRKEEQHIENRYYTPKTDIVERTLGRKV